MTLGPVMLDLQGLELSPEEKDVLAHPATGGVILFSHNYHSPEQIAALADAIHALRTPPLLVAVDQEGGRVQRFRDGFTHLPAAGRLGPIWDSDPQRALVLAERLGWLMAAEVRAVGVDLSFAPVLDLDRGISSVIGDRAFHHQPEAVSELALAYQRGMHHAGMASVGKHFPGHGGVAADSHLDLPEDDRRLADLELADLVPFARLIANGLNGVMAAHVVYPRIDAQAAGYSRFWLSRLLRGQMGFQGVIFSDDLSMAGAEGAGDYPQRARLALAAGCDMVLVCNRPQAAIAVVENLSSYTSPASSMRLARLHGRGRVDRDALRASPAWQQAVEAVRSCETEPWLDMDLE